jgi:hypothetical protein
MDIIYTDKCLYEIKEQKKFRYGIPVYTGQFRALFSDIWYMFISGEMEKLLFASCFYSFYRPSNFANN